MTARIRSLAFEPQAVFVDTDYTVFRLLQEIGDLEQADIADLVEELPALEIAQAMLGRVIDSAYKRRAA